MYRGWLWIWGWLIRCTLVVVVYIRCPFYFYWRLLRGRRWCSWVVVYHRWVNSWRAVGSCASSLRALQLDCDLLRYFCNCLWTRRFLALLCCVAWWRHSTTHCNEGIQQIQTQDNRWFGALTCKYCHLFRKHAPFLLHFGSSILFHLSGYL